MLVLTAGKMGRAKRGTKGGFIYTLFELCAFHSGDLRTISAVSYAANEWRRAIRQRLRLDASVFQVSASLQLAEIRAHHLAHGTFKGPCPWLAAQGFSFEEGIPVREWGRSPLLI